MPTPFRLHWAGSLALAAIAGFSPSFVRAADTNAAQVSMGARASAVAGKGARFDTQTGPDALVDNNPHTRMVVTGAPYTVTIELFQLLPVDRIAITQSDYETEVAPKDIEIVLDDGTSIKHTLEATRSAKKKPAWQEISLGGKTTQTIKITVSSNYEAKNNWGGIGDIAIWTKEDLAARFNVAGYDANAPTSVDVPSVKADETPLPVKMPPRVKDNEYPRTMFTPAEVEQLKAKINASEDGKRALGVLIGHADAATTRPVEYPDPKGPLSQARDRGDATMKAHGALSTMCGNLGRAYLFTGDKKYAEKCAEILKGYAKIYEQYPEHKGANANDTGKISAQRLSECMWLMPMLMAYDAIHDSGVLSADDHKLIETGLIRPCIEFVWRKSPKEIVAANDKKNPNWRTETPPAPAKRKPMGNWLNFFNSATIMAGSILHDQDYIDMAVANFRELIRNGISEDGMWGEGAVGYQYFAMAAMVPGIETAARQGIDLWSFDDNRVKLLFDTPRLYAYPDGSMPGINDSARVKGAGWQMIVMDYAYQRYGDPRYAGVINETPRQVHFSEGIYAPTVVFDKLPEPPAAKYPSSVFTGLGYSIIRNDNIYSLMDYGPHGGVHGHYDKLNFILYANGDEMGGEPHFYRYEDALHHEWTNQTLAHNTMAIDQRSQTPCEGKLLCYEAGPAVKVMRAEADKAYPGAIVDRTLVLTSDAVYDVYSARSSFDRTFDRTLRYVGKLDQLKGDGTTALGDRDGYQHVKVASRNPANDGWTGIWTGDKGPLAITIAGGKDQEIIVGTDCDQANLAILRQKGKLADVGVVYQPGKAAGTTAKMLDTGSPDLVAMQVQNADNSTTTIFVSHKQGKWNALGVESDASVLYLKRTGDTVAEALFSGGTFAKAGSAELKLETLGNAYGQADGGTLKQSFSWLAAK